MIGRIGLKTGVWLILINLLWAILHPLNGLDRITVYNGLVPGRERFGFAEANQPKAASVVRLEAMFAAHVISQPVGTDEHRLAVLGGSAAWGFSNQWDESVSACWNRQNHTRSDGKRLRAYNLAYPIPSVMRDLLILDKALDPQYGVREVYWFVSGLALFTPRQIIPSLVTLANPERYHDLLRRYPAIRIPANQLPPFPTLFESTLIGERAYVTTWVQDQLYGYTWLHLRQDATPIRQVYAPVRIDELGGQVFDLDREYTEAEINREMFSFDVLDAGTQLAKAKGVKLTFILDPMWRATSSESQWRENVYYPRWLFPQIQTWLRESAERGGWRYVDGSGALPREVFTESPFHYNPQGACQLAEWLASVRS
jgi:hypothetical protein